MNGAEKLSLATRVLAGGIAVGSLAVCADRLMDLPEMAANHEESELGCQLQYMPCLTVGNTQLSLQETSLLLEASAGITIGLFAAHHALQKQH